MSATRVPLAVLWAGVLSLAMFWVLSRLVDVHRATLEVKPATQINFTRLHVDHPVETRRPPEARRPPPTPAPRGPVISEAHGDTFEWSRPQIVDPSLPTGRGLPALGVDRDVQPLVRVAPDYPPHAAANGIEGWVKVQFTVTAAGTVRDAQVVAAEPAHEFDDAALAAIRRWHYNPKTETGTAVERVGLQTLIRFELPPR